MKQIGTESQQWLTPSESSERQKKASGEAMAEYFRLGRLLLGSYRTGEASDPEVYISGVVRILSAYPLDVVRRVVDPLDGIPSYCDWLPKFSEVKAACERLAGPTVVARMSDWDRRTQAQLEERQRLTALPVPKQGYAEFKSEMAARGLPIDGRRPVASDMANLQKYGITREQWSALPDIPQKMQDRWEES
jgi:hypothetical protein